MAHRTYRPTARTNDIVCSELDDELLVYDLTSRQACALSPTSAALFHACDGTRTIDQLADHLGIGREQVVFGLEGLGRSDLLLLPLPDGEPGAGMSRRQFAKRFGVAAAVTLPTVAVFASPALAQQGSCAPIGPCTGNGQVCTCAPIMLPGNNVNPNGCPCQTPGDCTGDCSCGSPCTGVGTQGNCPSGSTCNPDGSCSGVCLPSSFNFCVGGLSTGFCTNPFDNNRNQSAPCCQCNTDGDCIGSCSNNNAPGTVGVCV
jgi:hypothetical protein